MRKATDENENGKGRRKETKMSKERLAWIEEFEMECTVAFLEDRGLSIGDYGWKDYMFENKAEYQEFRENYICSHI